MVPDVQTAAQELMQAVLRHAQEVAGTSPDARQEAGRALVQALDDYGSAVAQAGIEPPEGLEGFDQWFDEEDGVVHPEPEPDLRQRIALFTRTDLAVTDVDRLRAAAAARLADCCGDTVDDVGAAVAQPAAAVAHLVGHEPTTLEPDSVEEFGLDLLSWTSTTVADVSEDDWDDPWRPLIDQTVQDGAVEQ